MMHNAFYQAVRALCSLIVLSLLICHSRIEWSPGFQPVDRWGELYCVSSLYWVSFHALVWGGMDLMTLNFPCLLLWFAMASWSLEHVSWAFVVIRLPCHSSTTMYTWGTWWWNVNTQTGLLLFPTITDVVPLFSHLTSLFKSGQKEAPNWLKKILEAL